MRAPFRRGLPHPHGEVFTITPSYAITRPKRTFISLPEVVEVLKTGQDRPVETAIQGTVARSGEVVPVTFGPYEEGWDRLECLGRRLYGYV